MDWFKINDYKVNANNSDCSLIPNEPRIISALKTRNGTIYWAYGGYCHLVILKNNPIYLCDVVSCGHLYNGEYYDDPCDATWYALPDWIENEKSTICDIVLAWESIGKTKDDYECVI